MRTLHYIARSLLIPLLLFTRQISAQEPAKTPSTGAADKFQPLEEQIEAFTERNDQETDFADITDEMIRFLNHPLNINRASENELSQLQLNDIQIQNLQNFILQYGEIAGPYELNLIPGFDSLLIMKLMPLISFDMNQAVCEPGLKNMMAAGRNQLIFRYQRVLETQQGYRPLSDSMLKVNPESRYLGGPERLFLRYGYNFCNKIRFGITMEKDPGETFFPESDTLKRGFDFYSGFFFFTGRRFLRQLAIGDYHVQFGQGLTMQSGMAFGKPASTLATRKILQPLKPSAGADENRLMRGIAASVSLIRNAELTLFYSSAKADARMATADSIYTGEDYIPSFQETGYHRTPGELAAKDAVRKRVYGGNLQARLRMFRLGATAFRTELGNPLLKQDALYRKYEFNGSQISNYGIDYAMILKGLTVYGEFAGCSRGGKAMLHGLTFTPDPALDVSMVYRNYAPDYQNLYSNAFSEGSTNANERGIYLAIHARLKKRTSVTIQTDHFRFPWLKYRVDAPSAGCEYSALIMNTPSRNTEILIRYRYRRIQLNTTSPTGLTDYPDDEVTSNIRAQITFKPLEFLLLKSRIETIRQNKAGSARRTGYLAFQDLIFNAGKKTWQLSTRFAVFDTDTYNQRLYAYENDVLYAFSVPAYYNRGSRFYLMIRYSPVNPLDLWVRYSVTYYAGQQKIGSGSDEINGNKKSELKFQVILRL